MIGTPLCTNKQTLPNLPHLPTFPFTLPLSLLFTLPSCFPYHEPFSPTFHTLNHSPKAPKINSGIISTEQVLHVHDVVKTKNFILKVGKAGGEQLRVGKTGGKGEE
jgi:hypothetical protein